MAAAAGGDVTGGGRGGTAARGGGWILDVLVVDHDPIFTSTMFNEFMSSISSSLLFGSEYHKNTNAPVEQVNSVLGNTQCAFAKGCKDKWDVWLPNAVFSDSSPSTMLPRRWAAT
jgi:hypothetical protein